MKITIMPGREEELILRCPDPDLPHIQALLALLAEAERRIPAQEGENRAFLSPADVLYAESVDRGVYVCTREAVYKTPLSLAQLESWFPSLIRCARTTLVRLGAIDRLRTAPGGRILATLANGERILITRRYAAALRERLYRLTEDPQKGAIP